MAGELKWGGFLSSQTELKQRSEVYCHMGFLTGVTLSHVKLRVV